jgi:hypothetical protein
MRKSAAREDERLSWFMATAYVLRCLGLLAGGKGDKLDAVGSGGASWVALVEAEFGIDGTFVRSVYALCSERMSRGDALVFILRGLGCRQPRARLAEALR